MITALCLRLRYTNGTYVQNIYIYLIRKHFSSGTIGNNDLDKNNIESTQL